MHSFIQRMASLAPWAALTGAALLAPLAAQAADPVVFTFATVGDSRQDPSKPDQTSLLSGSPGTMNLTGTLLPQDRQWLQNTKATARILRTITTQKPNLLFFNGDMIYGYGRPVMPTITATGAPLWTGAYPGASTGFSANSTAATVGPDFAFYYTQYAYWRGLFAGLFETGTYVVPVPGNHETQCNNTKVPYTSSSPNPNCASGTHAYADNETMFRNNMGDLIQDLVTNTRFQTVSGFVAQNANGLTSATAPHASANNGPITGDQTEMSYSFDIQTNAGLLHFAVISTDPSGADGIAPADWLASDLAAAKSRGAQKIFVFGHKPAFTYNYGAASGVTVSPGGLDATSPISYRNSFWSVIAQYNATYFSGHEHTVNVAQFSDPTGVSANKPYQVIVGSGGSPFDDALIGTCSSGTFTTPGQTCAEPAFTNPGDRFYAWGLVQIHQSGTVTLTTYGFSDTYGPTQTLYTVPYLQ
jgi:hypothetical protein